MFLLSLSIVAVVDRLGRPLSEGIPRDADAAHKRLVIVNAPDAAVGYALLVQAGERGGTPPERVLALTGNRRDVRLTRKDDRTILVHEDSGFTRSGSELLFADARAPLPVGTKISLSDVVVTVTHATPDGVPDEASFELTKPLEEAYVFRKWEGLSLVAFSLPPIGESVAFPSSS
jgi:hypothetical protein